MTSDALSAGYRLKLALEWGIALAGLVALAPALLALALAVALDSPGPVLFRQARLGRGGRVFTMYKFRTLRWDPAAPPRLRPDGSTVVEAQDERLTRTGRWLRRGLDELPQLWNVLRGEMSLIGPRPDEPFQGAFYTPEERRKLSVPPGITGLPQVLGRTNIPWKERIQMDLAYIDQHSFRCDLWIAARTLRMMFDSGSGRNT
jgi:lipopolysaccharide/colanic/teichoic acid biosynthesis glycosyltransferase